MAVVEAVYLAFKAGAQVPQQGGTAQGTGLCTAQIMDLRLPHQRGADLAWMRLLPPPGARPCAAPMHAAHPPMAHAPVGADLHGCGCFPPAGAAPLRCPHARCVPTHGTPRWRVLWAGVRLPPATACNSVLGMFREGVYRGCWAHGYGHHVCMLDTG